MLLLLLFLVQARADCTFRASVDDLDRALTAAEAAYASLDVDEFQRASTELDFVVPCLQVPVSVDEAARLHRLRGLGRFADGDRDGALQALLAARTLAPAYAFPEDVLPAGYELRTLYEGLAPDAADASGVHLPRPSRGSLWLDGGDQRVRPVDRPVLFQLSDATGAVVDTRYLEPDQDVPRYPGVAKTRTALLGTAAATGVGAAVLYGVAWSSSAEVNAPPPGWNDRDLVAGQRRTNTLTGGSAGLAVLALAQVGIAYAWGSP